MGGLGNQLFQISNLLSLSKDYNYKAVIPKLNKSLSIFKDRPVYWNSLFADLPLGKQYKYYKKHIESNEYKKITLNSENTILCGYYQSYKYFHHNKDIIIEKLFPNKIINDIKIKYKFFSNKTVSLHIRRGDYLKLSNIYKVLDKSYYEKALTYVPKEAKKIIFSDDIDFCKILFKDFTNIEFIENDIEDYKQLILMSLCTYNIISNSTFSWWAAYINQNNKKIICPENWYYTNNIIDIPIDWIKIPD